MTAAAASPDGAAAARYRLLAGSARHARRIALGHRHLRSRDVQLHAERGAQHDELPHRHHRRCQRSSIPPASPPASWGGEYTTLRDIYNFKITVKNASDAIVSRRAEVRRIGIREDHRGGDALQIVDTRDTLGGIVEVKADPLSARSIRLARLDVQVHHR